MYKNFHLVSIDKLYEYSSLIFELYLSIAIYTYIQNHIKM